MNEDTNTHKLHWSFDAGAGLDDSSLIGYDAVARTDRSGRSPKNRSPWVQRTSWLIRAHGSSAHDVSCQQVP